MLNSYLLSGDTAIRLYEKIKDDPIYDYHCHLSPKAIFEDEPFYNIGQMWLEGDHYKWRLMRAAGIAEEYITGNASYKEKFEQYAKVIEFAAGSPLYHWTQMELSLYFGINEPLCAENANTIWERANDTIRREELSPRKLITKSNVKYIATTDDPADTLEYHERIKHDDTFFTCVAPTFRTDNILLIKRDGYADYINLLGRAAGVEISNLEDLKNAIVTRLDDFCAKGCKFSDVGIAFFTDRAGDKNKADEAFKKAIAQETIGDELYMEFLGYMYIFLAKEYKKRNIVMQLHLAVMRNVCTSLYSSSGADSGGDCIGDPISGSKLAAMFDNMDKNDALPITIIYTLNPSMVSQMVTVAGSFRNVICGAAWWFCDNKSGILRQLEIVAEMGYLGAFLGMLTDSRSFLSYGRHDYFRRLLCSMIGAWVDTGEYSQKAADKLVKKLSHENIKDLIQG